MSEQLRGRFPDWKDYSLTATIADGQTKSEAIDLESIDLVGIFIPSGFDGTTLQFEAATAVDGTFYPVLSAGANHELTVAASTYVPIENLAILSGVRYLKIVTASQTGDVILGLALRRV